MQCYQCGGRSGGGSVASVCICPVVANEPHVFLLDNERPDVR